MPGPGPTRAASQPRPVGGVEGADGAERLVLAAVGGRGGDVAAEQAALAQLGDVARERAGQRAAAGLHVADLQPGRGLRRRPGGRREVAVQRQDQDRDRTGAPVSAASGDLPRTRGSIAPRPASTGCWSEV